MSTPTPSSSPAPQTSPLPQFLLLAPPATTPTTTSPPPTPSPPSLASQQLASLLAQKLPCPRLLTFPQSDLTDALVQLGRPYALSPTGKSPSRPSSKGNKTHGTPPSDEDEDELALALHRERGADPTPPASPVTVARSTSEVVISPAGDDGDSAAEIFDAAFADSIDTAVAVEPEAAA